MTEIAAPPDQQIMNVHVINRNDFAIRDRFDNIEYTFPKSSRSGAVPLDAANHIFGWFPGCDWDTIGRRHCQKRFGWNTPDMVEAKANDRYFENLEIQPIVYSMVPMEVDAQGTPLGFHKANDEPRPKITEFVLACCEHEPRTMERLRELARAEGYEASAQSISITTRNLIKAGLLAKDEESGLFAVVIPTLPAAEGAVAPAE